jgi:hypothetical protein
MSCKNNDCGCEDQPIVTVDNLCNTVGCAESPACEEYVSSQCTIQTFGIDEISLGENATFAEMMQRVILLTTDPTCLSGGTCGATPYLFPTGKTTTTISVGWKAVAVATSYQVEYKEESAGSFTLLSPQTTLSATIPNLTSGDTYHIRVNTTCAVGSCYSVTIIVTTT